MIRPTLQPHLLDALKAIAAGDTYADMARRFHISQSGAKARVAALYSDMGARDKAHAVALGYQTGVLQVSGRLVLPCLLAEDVPLEALVRARALSGLNQRETAAQLGRSSTWLSLRETGRKPFPLDLLMRYADIVGFDLEAGRPRLAVAA